MIPEKLRDARIDDAVSIIDVCSIYGVTLFKQPHLCILGKTMRPKSIFHFEWVSFAEFSILFTMYFLDFLRKLSFKNSIFDYTVSQLSLLAFNLMIVVLVGFLLFSFPFWLALLITRRRSRVAKFFYYSVAAVSVMSCLGTIMIHGLYDILSAVFIVEMFLFLLALFFLNRASSVVWLKWQ